MLRKMILIVFVSIVSLYASEKTEIITEKESVLTQFLSQKEINIINDVFMTLDISSALAIVDDKFLLDPLENSPKRINPDKSLLTLSFRF